MISWQGERQGSKSMTW